MFSFWTDWTLYLRSWHLWAFAIFAYLLGLAASILFCDDWISRSGALVTSATVGLLSFDIRKRGDYEESLQKKYFPKDGPHFQSSTVRAFYDELYKSYGFRRTEGFVVASATLVWGFGDLVAEKFC